MKPNNSYEKGSMIWSIMEGYWDDLTIRQIAEVLAISESTTRKLIKRIKDETGVDVVYSSPCKGDTLKRNLLENDWSDLTVSEIAEVLETNEKQIYKHISEIRKKMGIEIAYKREDRSKSK